MRARIDRGDQPLLPLQALNLPCAERKQGGETDDAEKDDEPGKTAQRGFGGAFSSSVELALGGLVGILQRDEHALDEPQRRQAKHQGQRYPDQEMQPERRTVGNLYPQSEADNHEADDRA